MELEQIKELDKKYYMNTFGDRIPLAFESGKGITLTATDGREYLDFFAGIAVCSLGYGHSRLVSELCDQVSKLIHCSNVYYIENQARLAQMLVENTCADRVFFANSGAEANEGALKLAKKYFYNIGKPEKHEIITLKNSFHGRTLATVAATAQEKYQKPYAPLLEKFIHVPLNDSEALKAAMNENTAAVMLELIQGESGVHPLSREYVDEVKTLCDKYGAFLIVDEVQTGVGRTGKLFAHELYDLKPDIFTVAKGLGGGVPVGAVCANERAASGFSVGDHGTTFGGNPLATRAGLVVLDELINGGNLEHVRDVGGYFKAQLLKLAEKHGCIAEVRGEGLMLGVEFTEDIAKEIGTAMRERGILVGVVGARTLRIVPPLVVLRKDIDEFTRSLGAVLTAR